MDKISKLNDLVILKNMEVAKLSSELKRKKKELQNLQIDLFYESEKKQKEFDFGKEKS